MRKDGVKPKHALFRNSDKPPRGMHINHEDLVALATGPPGQGEQLLKALDREIVSYKRTVNVQCCTHVLKVQTPNKQERAL